ncbi:MAG: MBL fold metallo-hydrolase [Candidatus Abawacabacteria bacterium]|nr:MBL fold metallo-hydrolase [Candidatus Abawacabacteria bacterium]
MFLTSFGAAEEVTGSAHLLEINGKKILLDCGLLQGHRKDALSQNRANGEKLHDVDMIVLSHAHIDHSGNIPTLVKNGFNGPIYTTLASADLCSVMLRDSAHIQEKDWEYLESNNQELPNGEPLYREIDAVNATALFIGLPYNEAKEIAPGVTLILRDAGHILGSALVELHIEENGQKKVLGFTGDLGRKNMPIIHDPHQWTQLDYLITESTYGGRLHDDYNSVEEELIHIINDAVAHKSKIIIPAFAVERTQEVIYHLNLLQKAGKIPCIPIYIDSPLAINATEIFRRHPECFDQETYDSFLDEKKDPFGFACLRYVRTTEESKDLNGKSGPMIIISASGMCESGRILHHLKNNIGDPHTIILVISFMAQNTLGRAIAEKQRIVRIFGKPYLRRAQVYTINAFSAHADHQELLDYVRPIKGLKEIFIVHGESQAARAIKYGLEDIKAAEKITVSKANKQYLL